MATIGQIYYKVTDGNSGTPISGTIDIFQDIVAAYGAKQFNKLGVQAPPGTRMVMNDTKTIMVGRTGVYELDEDINVESMYFIRPKKYVKNEEASNNAIKEGREGMLEDDRIRTRALTQLANEYPHTPTLESDPNYTDYWNRYNQIQSEYIASYQKHLSLFQSGSNGIYELPNPNNPNDTSNFEDLQNVIIDFTYV